jgi:molybdate transport system substrate-binding protein
MNAVIMYPAQVRFIRAGMITLALSLTSPIQAFADDIRLFSGGAPQRVLRELTPEFERTTGHRLVPTFALVTVIQQKLVAGEKADLLLLLPMPLIAATEKSLAMRPEGRGVLARVGIGVIVRDGAPKPDISTSDAVRKLLLAARTIALSHPGTPVGGHLQRMMTQLGIADEVKPKIVIKAAIDGGGELVAKGEADVGMYLVSEVQSIKGVAVVGLLPPPVQSYVVYGSAIPVDSAARDAALAFLKFISDPARSMQWTAAGFELVSGKQ